MRFGDEMRAVEQQLAIEAVGRGIASELTKAPHAGMLTRHRSGHRVSIPDVLTFS